MLYSMIFWFMLSVVIFPDEADHRNCDGKTIRDIKRAEGRIGILSKQYPDTWAIVPVQRSLDTAGTSIDGFDIIVPCELDDSFKREGLEVCFSARLKDSGNDFYTTYSVSKIYYGELTNIYTLKK